MSDDEDVGEDGSGTDESRGDGGDAAGGNTGGADDAGGSRGDADRTDGAGGDLAVTRPEGGPADSDEAMTVLLRLPESDREAFKDPLGPVFTDADELLAVAGRPLVAVGDVVTYHLRGAGTDPDVAVVDGHTERSPVDAEIRRGALGPVEGTYADADDGDAGDADPDGGDGDTDGADAADGSDAGDDGGVDPDRPPVPDVYNPAASLTADLLSTLSAALASDGRTTVVVEGEEDLATLPAVLAAPDGASVVYGQPGEGMVHVAVDDTARTRARELFDRLTGDHDRALAVLGVDDGTDRDGGADAADDPED